MVQKESQVSNKSDNTYALEILLCIRDCFSSIQKKTKNKHKALWNWSFVIRVEKALTVAAPHSDVDQWEVQRSAFENPFSWRTFNILGTFQLQNMFFEFRSLKCSSKMVLWRAVHWKVLRQTQNGSLTLVEKKKTFWNLYF